MEIQTPRLLLRELTLDDVSALNEIDRDETVTRYMSFDPRTLEQTREYVERAIQRQNATPRRTCDFAVVARDNETLIGRCGVDISRPEHFEGMLWYMLHPRTWGRGYAREAAGAIVNLSFETLGVHRLWADCDPRNLASCRVAESIGMRREGVLRENYWLKNEWCSTAVYAMLESDWRDSKQRTPVQTQQR